MGRRKSLNNSNAQLDLSTFATADEQFVLNLRGSDWQMMNAESQNEAVESCFRYWRARGLPYYQLSISEMKEEYQRLARVRKESILLGEEIQMSMVGLKIANFFHPQMWSVPVKRSRSPLEQFNDDIKLRKIIRKALRIWPDRFSVNESNLRRMLKSFSYTTCVSNFRPTAAKAVYETYSKDGDHILDFSAGYGGRLLGCLPLRRHYTGMDPCSKQINGLRRMVIELQKLTNLEANVTLKKACAEDLLKEMEGESFSLIFSSPPYFDNEKYCNDSSQSYLRYPTYAEWKDSFLNTVITESWRVLKPGGFLVLNVADIYGFALTDDVLRLATQHFKHQCTIKLRLGQKPYLRKHAGEAYRYEPVFIFGKARRRN